MAQTQIETDQIQDGAITTAKIAASKLAWTTIDKIGAIATDVGAAPIFTVSPPLSYAANIISLNLSGIIQLQGSVPGTIQTGNIAITGAVTTSALGTESLTDLLFKTNGINRAIFTSGGFFSFGEADNAPEFFCIGLFSETRFDNEGNLVRLRNVDYDWPTDNAIGTLTNDGAGNLTWDLLGGSTSGWSGYSGYSGDNPGTSGWSGYSGYSSVSGWSGYSGSGVSGWSGWSGFSGESNTSGWSGYSGDSGISGWSGFSGESNTSGWSGFSGISGWSGFSGESNTSGWSGFSGDSGLSGYSGSGVSGWSGFSGAGLSGFSGFSGKSNTSGWSGYSGISGWSGYSGVSGFSGFSGSGVSGWSGYSGDSGISGWSGFSGESNTSGWSGFSGMSGDSGISGWSGFSGESNTSGWSGFSGSGVSGWSGFSGSGISGYSGISGWSGISGYSGKSGFSGISGFSGAAPIDYTVSLATVEDYPLPVLLGEQLSGLSQLKTSDYFKINPLTGDLTLDAQPRILSWQTTGQTIAANSFTNLVFDTNSSVTGENFGGMHPTTPGDSHALYAPTNGFYYFRFSLVLTSVGNPSEVKLAVNHVDVSVNETKSISQNSANVGAASGNIWTDVSGFLYMEASDYLYCPVFLWASGNKTSITGRSNTSATLVKLW